MRIACFSVAAADTFPQTGEFHAGGNALNQSIRFREQGHETAFVGALGKDEAGDRIHALLLAEGVDCSHLRRPDGITACNQILNDADGERYGVEGAWKNGVYGDFRLTPEDWTFLSTFDLWSTHADGPNYEEALQRRNPEKWMAVDFLHKLDLPLLERSLSAKTICCIGGTSDMAEALADLAVRREGVLVLTLGAGGSMAFCGHDCRHQEALPLSPVIDTTGCGDAFQTGFTSTYIRTGDMRAALLAGAEEGRKAAGSRGGVSWKGI